MARYKRVHEAVPTPVQRAVDVLADDLVVEPEAPLIPPDWSPGALLNVRNGGEAYIVTLYPEEYDPRSPERALRFQNSALCQNFVSRWYARQHHDPRAW